MFRNRFIGLLVALPLVTLTACEATSPRAGTLSLQLTDAPGDVMKAVVTIEQVYLQPGEDGEDGRVILMDEPLTVDLITLQDVAMDLVQNAAIPGGTFTQLRFVVTGAYLEVETATGSDIYSSSPTYAGLPAGATVDGSLTLPSFAQTGIKVNLPNDALVVDGGQTTLVVDFDVAQSFGHQAGGSGNWVMTPVLNATNN